MTKFTVQGIEVDPDASHDIGGREHRHGSRYAHVEPGSTYPHLEFLAFKPAEQCGLQYDHDGNLVRDEDGKPIPAASRFRREGGMVIYRMPHGAERAVTAREWLEMTGEAVD